MTTQQYDNLIPREETQSSSSRLFSFERIRSGGSSTRFYPGYGAKLHFANRDVDTLELPGVPSGYLAVGDVVTATYKGVCVFRGDVATIVEHKARGTDATQTVTCVGPWSKMQRLVYRQFWYTGNGYDLSSRLILNQTKLGNAQNLNSELLEIATHGATACGYSVAAANVQVSTQHLPFDECRDITVADAIKRELRFFPKAVTRFDYESATPALHILGGSRNVSTASYVANIPKTSREYVYNAHPITGVDLEIETTGTIDGVEYRQITHQRTGEWQTLNPDCLYATLQIKGASSNVTRQSFKSVTEDLPANLNDVNWWKQKHPRLANVASSAITITNASRTIGDASCVRIAKATAGELQEAGLKCEVSKFTCTATIDTTDDKEETIYLTLNFLMTNATGTTQNPKTYTWVAESSSESGETVPAGLAAAILAERSGTLLSERMSIRLGDTLPSIGDALVESSQTLFLQQIDIDCGDLTADLSFGIPEYLSPEDMASLLSGFRNKRTSSSATIRTTGKTSDGGADVELGGIPPLSSSEFAPGTKAKTTIRNSGGSSGSIKLDASGDQPRLYMTDGNGHTLDIDLADIDDDTCSGEFGIHEIRWMQEEEGEDEPVEQIAHFIGCYDIDLTGASGGKTKIQLGQNNQHLQLSGNETDGYTLSVPAITFEINAGTGIKVNGSTISNTGVISVKGSQSQTKINGDIQVKGATDSGLIVTATQAQQTSDQQPLSNGTLELDIDGRAALTGCSKKFAAREFKYKDSNGDTQIYHFFGCANIDLTGIKGSQEQADWTESNSSDPSFIKNKPDLNVDVVTGIAMAVVDVSGSKVLRATITKKNLASGSVTSTTQDVITLTQATVVASSEYTDQQKLVNTLMNLFVLGTATPSPSTVDVFETTPHSLES